MQQMSVHLRFDQDEVDEQHHKVVLDVLVAEPAAVLAHRQADIVARRLVACALAPESLDGVFAFDADWHGVIVISFSFGYVLVFLQDRKKGNTIICMDGLPLGCIAAWPRPAPLCLFCGVLRLAADGDPCVSFVARTSV